MDRQKLVYSKIVVSVLISSLLLSLSESEFKTVQIKLQIYLSINITASGQILDATKLFVQNWRRVKIRRGKKEPYTVIKHIQ
jgi:hypothetical protein